MLLSTVLHGDLNHNWYFDTVWTTSMYLDTIAMLPQLWMLVVKGGHVEALTSHFVAAIFFSRFLTFSFWFTGFPELAPEDGGFNKMGYLLCGCHAIQLLLSVQAELKMKHLDGHYRVKHLVYLAIMGEKDVRGVCTPKLMMEIMELMDVNPLDEPYLIARIKVAIEDCYFRMKEIGAHRVTIENGIDVEALSVNLELDRVGFMKKISPSGLLYCVETKTALADVISANSHDVFCCSAAVEMHSTGKRQDVPLVFFEQSVCSECESRRSEEHTSELQSP